MNNELAQIEFYFPNGRYEDKKSLVEAIFRAMQQKDSVAYSGYSDESLLINGLIEHIGSGDIEKYRTITEEEKSVIRDNIFEAIYKFNKVLTIPTKNFIFVHPYLPSERDEVFEGVMAVAVYSCVFHVFIDLNKYTKKSLENTVAHELNHTVYYYRHYDDFNKYTLLDEILLEGLAENFREQYFDPAVTSWAVALSRDEAFNILRHSIDILGSRDQNVIREFLFGNGSYKRWTGYSAGYWLVKEFLNKSNLSWDEVMKVHPAEFMTYLH